MKVLYLATIFFYILGTGVGLMMIGVNSILDAWWQLSGVFAAGVLGLFLLGFVSRSTKPPMAMVSLCIGLVVIFWMSFSAYLPASVQSPFHTHMTIVIGTLSIFLIGLVGDWLMKKWIQKSVSAIPQ